MFDFGFSMSPWTSKRVCLHRGFFQPPATRNRISNFFGEVAYLYIFWSQWFFRYILFIHIHGKILMIHQSLCTYYTLYIYMHSWSLTAPEQLPSQKETIVFQPSNFRGKLLVLGGFPPTSFLWKNLRILFGWQGFFSASSLCYHNFGTSIRRAVWFKLAQVSVTRCEPLHLGYLPWSWGDHGIILLMVQPEILRSENPVELGSWNPIILCMVFLYIPRW